jgi:voltage-gated potassium channel
VARRLERPLMAAALLTIPTTALQFVHVGGPWQTALEVVDWAIWILFAVELVVMLAVASNRLRYLFDHPLDVCIVVLTPPVFAAAMQGFRVLRLLRLLRLLRVPGVWDRVFSADGVRFAVVAAMATAVGGGALFASADHVSLGNGVFWAVSTMATVGSIAPHTVAAKVIAVPVMLVGIAAGTFVIGAVANRFFARTVEEVELSEDDLLMEVRVISQRLQSLETALAQRRAARK